MAEIDATQSEANVSGATGPAEPKGRTGAWLKLGAFVLLIVGGFFGVKATPAGPYLTLEGIGDGIEWLRGNAWAAPIFIGIYATATALAVPGTILTLAGGAVFGFYWGTLYNFIAANIGANAAFLVARSLGGGTRCGASSERTPKC